ncbi:MAG: plasmid recombination protein [Oscillospiraceae bacterium]|nr:plasmid recombination protein [Oscillospiraceae bacterium]
MELEKFTDSSVGALLDHMNRIEVSSNNPDIVSERTSLNYSLTPYIDVARDKYQGSFNARADVRMQEYEYYKQRKSELYCYNRSDVNTMAGCVVPLPKELTTAEQQERFFKGVTQFLSERYGGDPTPDGRMYPNVISVSVHYDERQTVKDQLIGHLHFNWIPAVKINKDVLMSRKNHVKEMEKFSYKISAKEVITKRDLKSLHHDLQQYLVDNGIEGRVAFKGEGSQRNINIPTSMLKEYTNRTGKTLTKEDLRDLTVDKLADTFEKARSAEKAASWGDHTNWGRERSEDITWNR